MFEKKDATDILLNQKKIIYEQQSFIDELLQWKKRNTRTAIITFTVYIVCVIAYLVDYHFSRKKIKELQRKNITLIIYHRMDSTDRSNLKQEYNAIWDQYDSLWHEHTHLKFELDKAKGIKKGLTVIR